MASSPERNSAEVATGKEAGIEVFLDELPLSQAARSACVGGEEVFLRNLPCEDHSEAELHEILDGFGEVKEAHFLRHSAANKEVPGSDERVGQLSGCAYARFCLPEGASEILAAFPPDEESTQSTRSVSERLQQQVGDPDMCGRSALLKKLPSLRTELDCPSLSLLGSGCSEGGGIPAVQGPLRFAWQRRDYGPATEPFLQSLARAVSTVLEPARENGRAAVVPKHIVESQSVLHGSSDPNGSLNIHQPKRKRRRRSPEDDSPPSILVRAFPDSWSERDVQLMFTLFGGVVSVNFMGGPGNRVGHVKLKDMGKTSEAVAKLHGTEVGDGEYMEKCTISCELLGGVRNKERSSTGSSRAPHSAPLPPPPGPPPGGVPAPWHQPAHFFGPPGHWAPAAHGHYGYHGSPHAGYPGWNSQPVPPAPPPATAGQPTEVSPADVAEAQQQKGRRRRRKKARHEDREPVPPSATPRRNRHGPFSPQRQSQSSEPAASSFGMSDGDSFAVAEPSQPPGEFEVRPRRRKRRRRRLAGLLPRLSPGPLPRRVARRDHSQDQLRRQGRRRHAEEESRAGSEDGFRSDSRAGACSDDARSVPSRTRSPPRRRVLLRARKDL